jgi:hypothetical protein
MTDIEPDVTVVFSSPCTRRWCSGKQGDVILGCGMEILSPKEYLQMKKLLYDDFPTCLCVPWDEKYHLINDYLKILGLHDGPENYERRELFGMQPRYLFGSFAKTGHLLIYEHFNTNQVYNSIKSHKIVQLNYDVERKTFYHRFVSGLVISLAVDRCLEVQKANILNFLFDWKNQDSSMYANLFEKHIISLMSNEVSFIYRNLNEFDNKHDSFPPCRLKFFNYVTCEPPQIWYEDIEHTRLLGSTPITGNTLFRPTGQYLSIIDGVMLIKYESEEVITINFLQVTVRDN